MSDARSRADAHRPSASTTPTGLGSTHRARLLATYRLQLGGDLDFAKARALVPYLRDLGVSHLYLSPSLQARSGSTHGYDVVDPTRISDALGGERGLRQLAAAGMPIILDIVPNHMGTGKENHWWSDPSTRRRFFDLYPDGRCRRFFDIDDMAAIRQEVDEVFDVSHVKVLELLREGVLHGLRVDHPDGLADPAGYLRRLRESGVRRVWVEKILSSVSPREPLRDWPVTGTVGYEFLNDACALFVDRRAREPLTQLLAEVTGDARSFEQIATEAQLQQARGPFAPDVANLARIGGFDEHSLAAGLASLPIYRTYVESWSGVVQDADRQAVAAANMGSALAGALLLERDAPEEFVTRFQQLSPAIAAKGVEDTAFYRYLRLLCLNEVGGEPDRFGLSVHEFHQANLERAARFPEGLLATQTHDTKRSGDARARLGALSTMPERWRELVLSWLKLGEELLHGREHGPDRAEQYLIHQTLLSVWPIERERLDEYLVKALRERKLATSWVQPDERHERAVVDFASQLSADPRFLAGFQPLLQQVVPAGERSALGQLLLKLASPGVPDIYQGDELWRLSLVDPDNRRPVDWALRRELLDGVLSGAEPTRRTRKLHMIRAALDLRRRRPDAFADSYVPVPAGENVCAFTRGSDVLALVRIADASAAGAASASGAASSSNAASANDTELDAPLRGRWRDVLSGREHDLGAQRSASALGGELGLALLERTG